MRIIIGIVYLLTSQLSYAQKNSIYKFDWLDDDEIVYVLQNKEFPKEKRIGLELYLGDSANSNYQDSPLFGFSIYYSFSETFGVDLTYKSYSNQDNEDFKSLQEIGDGIKPLVRKIDSSTLVHFNWTPFYGKINTFNTINYFDWGLGLGLGQFSSQANYATFRDKNVPLTYVTEDISGFNFKSFFRFYAGEHLTLGFEYSYSAVQAIVDSNKNEDIIFFNDLSATIGYLF